MIVNYQLTINENRINFDQCELWQKKNFLVSIEENAYMICTNHTTAHCKMTNW